MENITVEKIEYSLSIGVKAWQKKLSLEQTYGVFDILASLAKDIKFSDVKEIMKMTVAETATMLIRARLIDRFINLILYPCEGYSFANKNFSQLDLEEAVVIITDFFTLNKSAMERLKNFVSGLGMLKTTNQFQSSEPSVKNTFPTESVTPSKSALSKFVTAITKSLKMQKK
jgi:hypothetical protein